MFSALVLSLLSAPLAAPAVAQDDPPIRISLNNDRRFEQGDRGNVKVRVENDGFLVVLHADPDGRVRMLFPLDPDDDNYVRGDRTYEIRGRGDRESFTVDYESGEGAIYAAISRDPFRFDQFVVNRHWDYDAFNAKRLPEQPEPELTELVQRMATGRFEYDYLTYNVYGRGYRDVVYAPTVVHRTYYDDPFCRGYSSWYDCDPYYYGRNRFSVNISFGRPYYYGGYYRPVYYDPFYDPYYYGYGYGYYAHPYYPRYHQPVYVYPGRSWGGSGYRPRYVNQTGFKQDTRTWGGESYRVRSTALSDIRAVNTVYGQPPARRAVTEGDVGKSPILQPSPSRDVTASPSRRPIDRQATDVPEARRSRQESDTKVSNDGASSPEPTRRERLPEAVPARPSREVAPDRSTSGSDRSRESATPRRSGSTGDRDEVVRPSRPDPVRARPEAERSEPQRERSRPEVERSRPEAEPSRSEEERSRPDVERRAEPVRAAPRRDESARAEPSRSDRAEPQRSAPRPSIDRAPAPSRPSVDRAPAPSRPSYSAPRQDSPSRSAPSGGSSGGGRRRTN